MYYDKKVKLSELNGKTIKEINGLEKDSEEVKIVTECGQEYVFLHDQDCCENVYLNDYEGDLYENLEPQTVSGDLDEIALAIYDYIMCEDMTNQILKAKIVPCMKGHKSAGISYVKCELQNLLKSKSN